MKQKKSVMYIFLEGAAALAVILMLGLFRCTFRIIILTCPMLNLTFSAYVLLG